jgi:cytoskeletal protein CcmA (bactofilin family)
MADQIIPDDSISGNKIHGGVISDFQSTGIQDLATKTSLVVTDGTATVDNIRTKNLNGNIAVNGNLLVTGTIAVAENTEFKRDLTIRGNIDANTITVRNLIADVKQETREPVTFIGTLNTDANNKGLAWRAGSVNESLLYRNGVLASTMPIDAPSYRVNGTEVITETALAASITKSNLRRVGRLETLNVDGAVEINGKLTANKGVAVDGNLDVVGEITARSIRVDQIITESGGHLEVGNFTADTEHDLDGQGLHFIYGQTDNMLTYRQGSRLWTTLNFDLQEGRAYHIDNTPVLSSAELGPTVTRSSLRQVGTLTTLKVAGKTTLSDYAYFEGDRLGLGTESPNGALGILDNNIEIVLGAGSVGRAKIGTFTNDGLDIVTDNISRVSIANSGEIVIGHPEYRNGVLRINGRLYVDEVVADTRLLRTTSLQFEQIGDDNFYGKGIEWVDKVKPRKLVYMPNPDRVFSTDHIDLGEDRCYHIERTVVLSKTTLGVTVTESNLSKVGVLRDLTVAGDVDIGGTTTLDHLHVKNLTLAEDGNSVSISKEGINFGGSVSISRFREAELSFDNNGITIGNGQNTNRSVRIFGRVGVGVNNVDQSVGLAVAGNFSFANKKFVNGSSAPTEGTFRKGDVCWNDDPHTASYAGWICISEGTPGEWRPFGLIA